MDKLKLAFCVLHVVLWVVICVNCQDSSTEALFPHILNLATRSRIEVNATCGEREPELFCKLVEHVELFTDQNGHCDYCDATKRRWSHPITNAIDGSNKWWQSPSVANGLKYNYITITLDLRQVYHVAYVIVKAANAPRPGNWILEKSIDGIRYSPWQYFASTNRECRTVYGIRPTIGRPRYLKDDDVICTSYYSRIVPLQNGEIFVSLVNGRPGVDNPSKVLLDFTSARFVRLRLQKISTLNADLMTFRTTNPKFLDPTVTRRYFYSIKDISISGQCICYGHARECRGVPGSDRLVCDCEHNTCGRNCETCCPGFHQKPWRRGTNGNGHICEQCNCHNHADDCVFNATVAEKRLSLNIRGEYDGGGVCLNCRDDTDGINCERCRDGYYRPRGVSHNSPRPCRPCNCRETFTSTDRCVPDDSQIDEGLEPGQCICKSGFGGRNCNQCALGYYDYPNCKPCPCDPAGSIDPTQCEGRCRCKANVQGRTCNQCKDGFYNLDKDNPLGCTECYCFGLSFSCQSAGLGVYQISDMRGTMDGWTITTLNTVTGFTLFTRQNAEGWLEYQSFPAQNSVDPSQDTIIYFWQAPLAYLGNRLSSYGGTLTYTIKYSVDRTAPLQRHIYNMDVIIVSGNKTITSGRSYLRENTEKTGRVVLQEENWFRFETTSRYFTSTVPITRKDFMAILYSIDRILIRATFHTGQDAVYLKDVKLEAVGVSSTSNKTLPSVEKCICPPGYDGLSCESCKPGYRRLDGQLHGGTCEGCNCNGHSEKCDQISGRCQGCKHFTTGVNCELCLPGYYGEPRRGTANDCKPCACPLPVPSNNFAEQCRIDPQPSNYDNYFCEGCRTGYTGNRCERCSPGYYGNPMEIGSYCQPCQCNGNIDTTNPRSCDPSTGICLKCVYNTIGERCDRCRPGFFGLAKNGDCTVCNCDLDGSLNQECQRRTGQCQCRDRFGGRRCDQCQIGYGNVKEGCPQCNCSLYGSISYRCDRITGQCPCRPGVVGRTCDNCQNGFYGFSTSGCIDCQCDPKGTNVTHQCSVSTGICNCLPNVIGSKCDACQDNYWGLPMGGGCNPCDCDLVGSVYRQCDRRIGQCTCRVGVGGRKCDACKPGYYGFSVFGCKVCRPCDKPGHICDPTTGACVCPPYTEGARCERCQPNAWGYDPVKGCKQCGCNVEGSRDLQCDIRTGQCSCKADYMGSKCDNCLRGFYNFPQCQRCICSDEGTDLNSCNTRGQCNCQDNGQCDCKKNVQGLSCTDCKPNTFSLDRENPHGCTECFCFERSSSCKQIPYVWSTKRHPDQKVSVHSQVSTEITTQYRFYNIIPAGATWVSVPDMLMAGPLYWSLPINGDQTLSYNGELTFTVTFSVPDQDHWFPTPQIVLYPEIVVLGNSFHLLYNDNRTFAPGQQHRFSVKLHENYWRVLGFDGGATRKMVMIVLQNVTAVLVRATYDDKVVYAEISQIGFDVAEPPTPGRSQDAALGVEICECPDQYSGISCQNPSEGYYRFKYNLTMQLSDPIRVIGGVEKCQCYSHSDKCDVNTGVCLQCLHNTVGWKCDMCAPDFYGNATRGTSGDCRPCPCPTVGNSFSPTCDVQSGTLVCTACQVGYTGTRCEICAEGYYGNPRQVGGSCKPCNCNLGGSVSAACDNRGHCTCLPGIMGIKCDSCQPRHAVKNGECVSCDVGCTKDLMKDLDDLESVSLAVNLSGIFPVPWDRLWNVKNETEKLKGALVNVSLAGQEALEKDTSALANKAMTLLTDSSALLRKGLQTESDGKQLKKNAEELEKTVNELFEKAKDDMNALEKLVEHLFNNQSGINVTAAFAEARAIMKEISDRNFDSDLDRAQKEKALVDLLMARVENFYNQLVNTTSVRNKLEDTLARINDLKNISQDTERKVAEFFRSNKILQISIKKLDLEDKLFDIELDRDKVLVSLGKGHQINNESNELLRKAKINIKNVKREASIFDYVIPELEKVQKNFNDKLPMAENLTKQAVDHANNLTNYADYLDKLFEQARANASAANVYNTIIAAITEAKEAAEKALKAANESTRIADIDNVKLEVEKSLNKSLDLLRRANNTKDRQKGLESDLNNMNSDLDSLSKDQKRIRQDLQDIRDALRRLPTSVSTRAKNVNDDAMDTKNNVDKTSNKVDDLIDKINNILKKRLENMQNLQTDKLKENIRKSVDKSRQNVKAIQDIMKDFKANENKTKPILSSLEENLKQLRDKIKQARATADQVKVSLYVNGSGYRSYPFTSQDRTITNSISFMFKTSAVNKDALIIMATDPTKSKRRRRATESQEFMAIDMYKGKIRFSWDVGSGLGQTLSDVPIQREDSFINEKDKWYYVKAERIGRQGSLLVFKIVSPTQDKVTNASLPSKSILDLGSSSRVFVAGAPPGLRPGGIAEGNFTGCLGEVHVDENKVGLHNFIESYGYCWGCKDVPTAQSLTTDMFHFNGLGYAAQPQIERYNSIKTFIKFSFKTYWENATLLFSGDPKTGDFIYIGLLNKRIVVQIYMGGTSMIEKQTKNEYNDNKKHKLVINRKRLRASLSLNDGSEVIPVQAPGSNTGLELKRQLLYFGGTPESIDTSSFKKLGIEIKSFFGCMGGLQIGSEIRALNVGEEVVGVKQGCPTTGYKTVGFYGEGYAQFDGKNLLKDSDLTLSFRTQQDNALILLARDDDGSNYYSLAIVDGHVEGKFSGSRLPLTLTTKKKYNDGRDHVVAVKRTNSEIKLMIDDDESSAETDWLPSITQEIVVDHIYLGGLPMGSPDGQLMVANIISLYGCLSNIILNGVIFDLNNPLQYEKADIGRCLVPEVPPPEVTPEELTTPVPTAPTTCASLMQPTMQIMALTFGDAKESFGEVSVQNRDVSKGFNVTFEFRTFYPSGTIFIMTNDDQSNYVAAQLFNGFMTVVYKNNNKILLLNSTTKVDDGQWHKAVVRKGTKLLRLKVDSGREKSEKINGRLVLTSPMYVGTVVPSVTVPAGLVGHSIRGCIRNYLIDGDNILIADAQTVSGITSCFDQIEQGVYFSGTAYGILEKNYIVGEEMSMAFEFRTSKPNGVFVTVSERTGDPALTLELYQGQVQLTVNNKNKFTASTSGNEFQFCDNKWHKIEAQVIRNVVTLTVDGKLEYGDSTQADISTDTNSPLFIGGVPDVAKPQGAASSDEFFVGCIKNFFINKTPVNWFSLYLDSEISKTSCPVN